VQSLKVFIAHAYSNQPISHKSKMQWWCWGHDTFHVFTHKNIMLLYKNLIEFILLTVTVTVVHRSQLWWHDMGAQLEFTFLRLDIKILSTTFWMSSISSHSIREHPPPQRTKNSRHHANFFSISRHHAWKIWFSRSRQFFSISRHFS